MMNEQILSKGQEAIEQRKAILNAYERQLEQKKIRGTQRELKDSMYYTLLANAELDAVKDLNSFPEYVRVQLMSPIEIKHYKDNMMEETNARIEELVQKRMQSRKVYEESKKEWVSLNNTLALLDSESTEYKRISKEIEYHKQRMQEQTPFIGDFKYSNIHMQIEDLKNKINKIMNFTDAEFKDYLCLHVTKHCKEYKDILAYELNSDEDLREESALATIAIDASKAMKTAQLYKEHHYAENRSSIKFKCFLHYPNYKEFKFLEPIFKDPAFGYNFNTYKLESPHKTLAYLENLYVEIKKIKSVYDVEFTEEKLLKLNQKRDPKLKAVIDIKFLKMHQNKINPELLSTIIELDSQLRDCETSYFRSLIKSKEIQMRREELRGLEEEAYMQIKHWYTSFDSGVFQLPPIQFEGSESPMSNDRLIDKIRENKHLIVQYYLGVSGLYAIVDRSKDKYESRFHHAMMDKTYYEEQISRVAGSAPFTIRSLPTVEENMKKIIECAGNKGRRELINDIYEAVKREATETETRLLKESEEGTKPHYRLLTPRI